MKSSKIRLWAAGATASILALTACGGGGSNAQAPDFDLGDRYTPDAGTPAWQLDSKEEMTELTWYVNADWWNDSWGEDLVTKKIEEDLKIKVKFLKGDDTKMNTMFASGDLPDIVTVFDANSKVATSANTWAYSLDELAKAYDPYWYEVAAEDTLNWHRLSDGNVYGYPNYSNTAADYESGIIAGGTAFIIQKDVYEALGEPSFATQEDFRKSMQLIADNYPDLIPFGFNETVSGPGSLGDILQDYLGVPLENEDGSFYDRNLDEDYLSWIQTLRQVREDGNISDDSFADDGTAFHEKIQTGRYASIFLNGIAQASGPMQNWLTTKPESQYIAVQGPASTQGNKPTLNQSGITGWMINYISKQAKDPAKAMQVFTYLQSEYGGILTTYGVEGETFDYNSEGRVVRRPEIIEMQEKENTRYKEELRLGEFFFFGHDRYLALAEPAMTLEAAIQPMDWGREHLSPHFLIERIDPEAGTPEARNLTGINTTWANTLVTMIRGSEAEFQTTLKAYQDFLAANGWDDIVQTRTENMARNRELLGING